MAWLETHIYSNVLGVQTTVNVLLPDVTTIWGLESQNPVWDGHTSLPTLYLLHGLSDDHSIWHRFSSIEQQAQTYPMAIVMPAVNRSFYSNQVYGYDYLTYVGEELPEVTRKLFKLSDERENTFVAGVSMGGYGAMKLGLTYPERFGRIVSFSGILDYQALIENRNEYELTNDKLSLRNMSTIDAPTFRELMDFCLNFGSLDDFTGSDNDLMTLLERQVLAGVRLPEMLITMGREDPFYNTNVSFRSKLDALHFPYKYIEKHGGHNWKFWDREMIGEMLKWLPVHSTIPDTP